MLYVSVLLWKEKGWRVSVVFATTSTPLSLPLHSSSRSPTPSLPYPRQLVCRRSKFKVTVTGSRARRPTGKRVGGGGGGGATLRLHGTATSLNKLINVLPPRFRLVVLVRDMARDSLCATNCCLMRTILTSQGEKENECVFCFLFY